jgi:hypothetical protein
LQAIALEKGPSYTNKFKNNVLVDTRYATSGGNGTEENSAIALRENLDENFKFNRAALAQIREQIPGFNNFDIAKIGYKDPTIPTPTPKNPSGGGTVIKTPAPTPTPKKTPTPTPEKTPKPIKPLKFKDLNKNAWYYEAVDYAYQNDLMVGMEEDEFAPDRKASRAMILSILWRLDGQHDVASESSFKDVSRGAWYEKAVIWAHKKGIVSGYDDGTFKPDGDITRQEIAIIVAKYLKLKGISTGAESQKFADDDSIAIWAKDSANFLKSLGIMQGREGNEFDPKAGTSRAETAQLLMNLIEKANI